MANYFKIGQGNQWLRPVSATSDFRTSHGNCKLRSLHFASLSDSKSMGMFLQKQRSSVQLIVADHLLQTFWAANWNNFMIVECGLSTCIAILTVLISSLLDTKAHF